MHFFKPAHGESRRPFRCQHRFHLKALIFFFFLLGYSVDSELFRMALTLSVLGFKRSGSLNLKQSHEAPVVKGREASLSQC